MKIFIASSPKGCENLLKFCQKSPFGFGKIFLTKTLKGSKNLIFLFTKKSYLCILMRTILSLGKFRNLDGNADNNNIYFY